MLQIAVVLRLKFRLFSFSFESLTEWWQYLRNLESHLGLLLETVAFIDPITASVWLRSSGFSHLILLLLNPWYSGLPFAEIISLAWISSAYFRHVKCVDCRPVLLNVGVLTVRSKCWCRNMCNLEDACISEHQLFFHCMHVLKHCHCHLLIGTQLLNWLCCNFVIINVLQCLSL